MRSLGRISVRDLRSLHNKRFLCKISVRDLSARSPYTGSITDLHARSLQGISLQDDTRSLCKVSSQDLCASSSTYTRPPCQDSAPVDRISTAPQRERSDTHNVTRGVARGISKNEHRHSQSDLTRTKFQSDEKAAIGCVHLKLSTAKWYCLSSVLDDVDSQPR